MKKEKGRKTAKNLPVLGTERLVLRLPRIADAPEIQKQAGKWAVAEMTANIPHPYKNGMAEKWIRKCRKCSGGTKPAVFVVTLRGSGKLVGATGLHNISQKHRRAELGYWVAMSCWGKGYATEAAAALLEYGFSVFGLNRISAHHLKRNPASGRVMQKIGMTYEGVKRQAEAKRTKNGFAKDQYDDLVFYGLLKKDWKRGL